jgi:rRNA-processing protein FCF1
VSSILRSVGINLEAQNPAGELELYREVIASKIGDRSRFLNPDEAYIAELDEQLRSFDEIYIDTAPIIQKDWFLHFVTNAESILKRRKKKLIILEKTLEELHGLKDNQEKDKEVRIRSTIRPDLIRFLAKRGLVRIGDTGSQGIADDHLVQLFTQIGSKRNLLLITQDRGLSERIVRLSAELEKKEAEQEELPWFRRLFSRKSEETDTTHRMVVCKLVEEGKLKRCYICPECNESYYDDLHDCEGMVLCGRCYLNLKEQEAKQEAVNKKQREAELQAEEERQKRMEAEEARLEYERSRDTVENRLRTKRGKVFRISLIVLLALLLILLILLLVL